MCNFGVSQKHFLEAAIKLKCVDFFPTPEIYAEPVLVTHVHREEKHYRTRLLRDLYRESALLKN